MRGVCAIFLCCMLVLFLGSVFVRDGHSGTAGFGWIPDRRVVNLSYPTNDSFLNPSIGADSLGNLHAAYRDYSPFSGYTSLSTAKSVDGGKTWNFTGSMFLGGNTQDPCLTVAKEGNNQVLIAFEANGSGICLETKLQDGSSFGRGIVSSAYVHNPQLVVDTSVPIYAYLVYENDSTSIPEDSDIYFMRSTDYYNNWTTWEEPYALAGASDTVTYSNPTIAYGSGGNLYVAFERNSGSLSEIYLMQNTFFGNRVNWGYTPGTLISPSTGLNKHRPRIAASHTAPGTVIVTWEEEYSSTDYDIGYANSIDTGSTWSSSSLYLARTSFDERKPSIVVDDSGFFHVAYWSGEDAGDRINGIYYRNAVWNAPDAWTAAEQVIDDNGQAYEPFNQPAITAQERGGASYPVIAWTDSRIYPPSVYCTTKGAICTILSNPSSSGGLPAVQVDGKSYETPVSFIWPAGLDHTIDAPSPQTGDGIRYLFTGWSDAGSQTHQIVAGTLNATITASFVKQYGVTVSTDPPSLSPQPDVIPAGLWYNIGTVVNVTAQAVIGSYSLDHWTVDGADIPPDPTISVVMSQPHNIIAKYGLDTTAPLISNLVQDPVGQQVAPGQSVNIQVTVADTETGVKNVTLQYRTSPDNATWSGWTISSMNEIARDTYSSSIMGFDSGTFVQYKIGAFDSAENYRILPATMYFDYFVIPELTSLIMTTAFLFSAATLLFLTKRKRSP